VHFAELQHETMPDDDDSLAEYALTPVEAVTPQKPLHSSF